MTGIMTEKPEQETVWVRRQWNDWRHARYTLDQIEGLHMDDLSGGLNARSPRPFLHGYVWCDGMIEGELAHSCSHGQGPHRIKVCVVKKDNSKTIYEKLRAQAR